MASVEFGKEVVKTMHMLKEKGAKVSFDPNVRLEMLKEPEAMEVVKQVTGKQIFLCLEYLN